MLLPTESCPWFRPRQLLVRPAGGPLGPPAPFGLCGEVPLLPGQTCGKPPDSPTGFVLLGPSTELHPCCSLPPHCIAPRFPEALPYFAEACHAQFAPGPEPCALAGKNTAPQS